MSKTIVLIIASMGYQPAEYGVTKQVLEKAGVNVVTASNAAGTARSSGDQTAKVDLVVGDVDPASYDGIFLVGGPGALEHLDTPAVHSLMQNAAQANKPFGAICISPRILAKAGVLKGKQATGWDQDNQLAGVFKAHGVTLIKKPVVTDGMLVTADGPAAAQAFGQAIARVLQ